jgi:hypothetical protein
MTVLGKILTFFIFFFSLVFLAFAFTINQVNKYKDPTDGKEKSWYQAFLAKDTEVRRVTDDLKARDEEIAKLRGELASQTTVVEKRLKNMETEVAEANAAKRKADSEKRAMEAAFFDSQVASKNALEELKRRRAENVELVETLKTRESDIANLRTQVTEANNVRTKAEVEAASYRVRLQKMEKDYADLARSYEELVADKARKSAEGGLAVSPPENVSGEIEEVGADGHVSISIGSDAGLLVGHTLNVFRLEPKPMYLGEMRITDVTPHKAVGRLLNPEFRKQVKKGDKVANKIIIGAR